nr:LOW QUALITY PROTEIN: leucine-rich repeat-containing protein 37A3-like [Vicugna pacos]
MTAASSPGQDQAQSLQQPSVTVKPVDLALTITPGPTSEAEPSPSQQEASAQSAGSPAQLEPLLVQQETLDQPPAPSGNEPFPVQLEPPTHPPETSTAATVHPLDLELTLSPEPNTEARPSPTTQGTPTWPPEPHQPSLYQEVTVPTPDQDHLEHLMSSSVIDKPLDLELTMTSEPTTEAEHSTSSPPEHPEVTRAPSSITPVTVHTVDLEVTVTGASSVDVEPSPTKQETSTQPPERAKEIVVQYPPHQEVTIPTPSKVHGQHTTPSSVTPHHVDLELTVTSEPAMEAQHSTVLRKTTAPSPEGGICTPRPDSSHSSTYRPGIYHNSAPRVTEDTCFDCVNICQLCTCSDETLSCVGLSPKERLHRVPVPEPDSYNGTFTVLDFQGNSISYIDENTWKPYHWTEKLDLSCNKIQFIESGTFESLPFLQFVNLGCNSVTDLSFGTFRAAHGMQFLQKV